MDNELFRNKLKNIKSMLLLLEKDLLDENGSSTEEILAGSLSILIDYVDDLTENVSDTF